PHGLAAPFSACAIGLANPRPRHRKPRGSQAGGQRPLARAVAVPVALLADARRPRGAPWRLELRRPQFFAPSPPPPPHRLLNAVAVEVPNLFRVAWLPGTVLHRVILRHPPGKRVQLLS